MTTGFDGVTDLVDIRSAVLPCSKKMKDRAVVPHVVSTTLQPCFRDIRDEPLDPFSGQAESPLGYTDSGLRNIENGHVPVSAREEVINERGFPATNVNDGCRISTRRPLN